MLKPIGKQRLKIGGSETTHRKSVSVDSVRHPRENRCGANGRGGVGKEWTAKQVEKCYECGKSQVW